MRHTHDFLNINKVSYPQGNNFFLAASTQLNGEKEEKEENKSHNFTFYSAV